MTKQKFVLIAEDEADMANLLQFHLQRLKYRTLAVPDGRSALNAVFEQKPDLVVLDLMLPHLHGYEVCRLVKAAPLTHQIPVLILTAMGGNEDMLRGFKMGADDYMIKPFDPYVFLARVNAMLRRAIPSPAPQGAPRKSHAIE